MKIFLSFVVCLGLLFVNSMVVMASDEISISMPRTTIFLSSGLAHVMLKIKIQNHEGNRKLRLDWEMGATEVQLNNPTAKEFNGGKPYEISKEDEFLIFTDDDLRQSTVAGMGGLLLPLGQYEVKATLIRMVDGKEKEFTATIEVTIGTPEGRDK